ncbi:LuxR C-terminal-related transcriptional regulator [Actinoplanes sp. HUAS TT8]|uniref:helix-turn-helix transcriptional regulator n=1 Tax=Actinoplanes sp. HUAS TT8 TaxID=3447453 RepID=UPI003F51F042
MTAEPPPETWPATLLEEPGRALTVTGDDHATLLDRAAAEATDRGWRVLRVTGVPAEADVPYAALERLLRPLVTGSAHRTIDQVLAGDTTDRRAYRVALAVVDLIEPSTLLIAGDAQWLDEPTWQVLTFAGRRLTRSSLLFGLGDGPRRLTCGPDEAHAHALEWAARQQERRGDTRAALVTWKRAAALAADPARYLFRAAVCADDAGVAEAVRDMIDRDRLTDRDRLWLNWHDGGAGADLEVTNARLLAFAQVSGGAFDILGEIVVQLFVTPLEAEVRAAMTDLARRDSVPEARAVALLALVAPLEHGKEVLAALPRFLSTAPVDAAEQTMLAWGALAVGAVAPARTLIAGAIARCRDRQRLGRLTQALVTEAWIGVFRADAHAIERAASEAITLAERTAQPRWAILARLARGMVAALRGDQPAAETAVDTAVRELLPNGAHLIGLCQLVRGTAALAVGNGVAAFDHLRRMFDRGDIAFHPTVRFWAIGSLTEAAVLAGRTTELAELLAELDEEAETRCSPALARGLYAARVQLRLHESPAGHAPGEVAEVLPAHPFDKARADFAYGVSLRRDRQHAEARPYLRAAASLFDAHGADAWADRARQELRATGESVRRPGREALTAQESEIAELAALGLTNKEIAQRLFLSPRTVSSHLYRIFPKLGVTARSELATALNS